MAVQDQWGRYPGDAMYGKAPGTSAFTLVGGQAGQTTDTNPYTNTGAPNPYAAAGTAATTGSAPADSQQMQGGSLVFHPPTGIPAPPLPTSDQPNTWFNQTGPPLTPSYLPPPTGPLTSVVQGATGPITYSPTAPTTTAFKPDPNSPTFGISLDPAKKNDEAYWREIMAKTAIASGQTTPVTPEQEAYWFSKFRSTGGLDDYWLGRLLDLAPGHSSPGMGTPGDTYPGTTTATAAYPSTNIPEAPSTLSVPTPAAGLTADSGASAQGGTPTVGGPSTVSAGPTSAGLKGTLEEALMKRITQSLDINPNDPIIRNQTEAYSGQQQNALRNYLSQVAEAQGPIANISAERRSGYETVGQNTSAFQASLMANELKARRDEIQNALIQTQAYITDEEKMALEAQLAQLDNALQYAKLAEQKSEFGQSLGQQESQFGRNLSQNAWLANLENAYKYATLGQQAYQFDVTRQDNILG